MLRFNITLNTETPYDPFISVRHAENWLAPGTGALLVLIGASRRSAIRTRLAVSAAPLLYRGITGEGHVPHAGRAT